MTTSVVSCSSEEAYASYPFGSLPCLQYGEKRRASKQEFIRSGNDWEIRILICYCERWLRLINYENRQCGLLACKALMKEGGIIACDSPRRPMIGLHPAIRAGLIETARRLNPLVLRWGS